jgi:hypothetical protein
MKLEFTPAFNPRPIEKVSCCHPVYATIRGRNEKLGNKCGSQAKIIIDGKAMCLRHAQQYALNVLIRQKMAKELKE